MAVVKTDAEPLPVAETAPPPTGMPLPAPAAAVETAATANGVSAEPAVETSTLAANLGDVAFGLPGAAAPAAELAAASFAEGVPLDFAFYALRKYGGEPLQQAVDKALAAIMASGPTTESIAADEVVVGGSLYTHPSLYAGATAIRDDERIPRPWLDKVNRNRATIERTLRSVGRIQLHYFDPRHPSQLRSLGYEVGLVIGTGVVVGDRVVMTNRHVADEFARVDAGVPAFRKDARSEIEPVVLIDFGGIYDDLPDLHRVEDILYLAAEGEPDVALLKLKEAPGRPAPPPIPLQTVEPAGRTFPRDAFVVGFPTTDPSDCACRISSAPCGSSGCRWGRSRARATTTSKNGSTTTAPPWGAARARRWWTSRPVWCGGCISMAASNHLGWRATSPSRCGGSPPFRRSASCSDRR